MQSSIIPLISSSSRSPQMMSSTSSSYKLSKEPYSSTPPPPSLQLPVEEKDAAGERWMPLAAAESARGGEAASCDMFSVPAAETRERFLQFPMGAMARGAWSGVGNPF
jgi:hypothetical protein